MKPYGFYVHGGIDGESNYAVYMVLALNKEASSLYAGYSDAISAWGHPVKLRADMCFEAAAMIGADMILQVSLSSAFLSALSSLCLAPMSCSKIAVVQL